MKATKDNQYKYTTKTGYAKGFFKIYQAKSGKIILAMGNSITQLTKEQILDLNIDLYSLEDYCHDDFLKAYEF